MVSILVILTKAGKNISVLLSAAALFVSGKTRKSLLDAILIWLAKKYL